MAQELRGAPDWVTSHCSEWKGFRRRDNPICAASSVSGVTNINMARDSAANRARVDIARQLEIRVAAMVKDYQSTAAAGVPLTDGMSDEQYITSVSRSISEATVSGAEIKETWTAKTGTLWTLVSLDFDKFAPVIDAMREMSPQLRQHLRDTAERELADLDDVIQP